VYSKEIEKAALQKAALFFIFTQEKNYSMMSGKSP